MKIPSKLDINNMKQPSPLEMESLRRVFQKIDVGKDGKLGWHEINDVLAKLGHKTCKAEIESMIWEVDSDLDGGVNWNEFAAMYKRCISDETGLEPRNLFFLVQFLMYDTEGMCTISVEQTLQILFLRYGREKLDKEIQSIFGEDEKGSHGEEKRITFSEYLETVKKRLALVRNTKKLIQYTKASARRKHQEAE